MAALRVEGGEELAAKIAGGWRTAGLAPEDAALLEYAEKLTRDPGGVTAADVEALRNMGWSDRAIHDCAQTIAYFNYINRVADGLGADLEDWMKPSPDGAEGP